MGQVALPAMLAMQAVGGLVGADAERDAHYRNAAVEEENARLDILEGERESYALLRQERQQVGASIAASGSTMGGSIETLIAESARQVELDIERVRQTAHARAANSKTRAEDSRRAGKSAWHGGIFSAVSTAISGASAMRSQSTQQQALGRYRQIELGS